VDKAIDETDPERLTAEKATEAVQKIGQATVEEGVALSIPEVKDSVLQSLKDVQRLPNSNPNKTFILKEYRKLLYQLQDLERNSKRVEVKSKLEDISRLDEALDDIIKDDVVQATESTSAKKYRDTLIEQRLANRRSRTSGQSGSQPIQLVEGRNFNKLAAFDYPYRELPVENPLNPKHPNKLDGYIPGKEIVSRKKFQLSKKSFYEFKSAIDEFSTIYKRGTRIASEFPSSGLQTGGGPTVQRFVGILQGEYFLEVEIQIEPVPKRFLEAARDAGVTIRDIAGKVYRLN
jgi:hypothetical protein